jgi:PKD repeat protein
MRKIFGSTSAAIFGLLWHLGGSVGANAQPAIEPGSHSFPQISLPDAAHGEQAIRALGQHLPEIAQAYGKSIEELTDMLGRDHTLTVDRRGRLFYLDDTLPLPQPETTPGSDAGVAAAAESLDQTFFLHSRRGAKRIIYLDFNGHVLSGTSWNDHYTGGQPINCPPFDFEGGPSVFTTNELAAIQEIWQRVAEDYAPFDLDVTTEDMGEAALTRSSSSDEYYGVRVLISPISSYFGPYGGIAYVGAFNDTSDYYKPALVFPENLGPNLARYVAEACSHEAGHTLGLSHDGTTTGDEYFRGYGSGATSWAPIMGASYGKSVTQWSKGEYTNANNQEDDLAIIASYVGYRPDDHGNDSTTATVLPSGSQLNAIGVIERNTDMDVFAFTTGAGAITINVKPAAVGPNLDILAELFNAAGNLVASSNPAGPLTASLSLSVPAGKYYLRVSGTGYATPTTGYSSYDSLGQYTITGTVVAPTGTVPPVAVPKATPTSGTAPLTVQFDASQSYDSDGTVTAYLWTFGDGTTSTARNPAHVYSSVGTYNAALKVTDNDGNSNSSALAITVSAPNTPPRAVATVSPASGYAPLTVTLNGSGSSDPDGSIASYSWNFGDGSTGAGATVQHTYQSVGTFTARLTVTDNRGATSFADSVIQVQTDSNGPANTTLIRIPDSGIASPYPSAISVAGLPSNPSKVTVTVTGISHTYPDDLDILLVGPGGQKVLLMSDASGGADANNVTLTFDDAAASNLPDSSGIVSGTYKPTDFEPGDIFPSPAPAGPYGTTLSAFNGLNPNGTWSLYVLDDAAGDSGSISAGWSLKFSFPTTSTPVVVLSAPASGATFTAPATINLAASVTPNGHTISKVQFFNGAAFVGEDTTAPYAFAWTGVAAGSYSLTARAVYDAGSTATSAPVGATVQGITPNTNPANLALINIPDSGTASLYPSKISVASLPSNPVKVTVTLTGISHTYPDDLDILLVGPGGQKVLLMSDAGGGTDINNLTLTFDDAAGSTLSDSSAIVSGTYKPTDFAAGDTFPAPAPAGPYGTALSAFTGLNPNGVWSLYVLDDAAGDSGSIAGGWSLKFTY